MTEQNQPPITKADQEKTQVTTQDKKPATLAELINSPKIKNQLALALPKHMNSDRMARIITTEIRKVPALAKCNFQSFLGAAV